MPGTPRRPWRAYVGNGMLALLAGGTLVFLVVALLMPDELQLWLHGIHAPSATKTNQPSPSPATLAPTSVPGVTVSPDPAAVDLKVTDLPYGYHVLKAGPAVFNTTDDVSQPAGWDVVFAPDADRQPGYLLIESVIAVYADVELAADAVEAENAAEQSAHAVREPLIPGLAVRQTAWIEPAPDRAGYGIVRITWQESNVVGQVGALGPISSSEPQQTGLLAMIMRNRISTGTRPSTQAPVGSPPPASSTA